MAENKPKNEIVRTGNTPSFSADGVTDTLINANTTKVTFYNVEEPAHDGKPERRRVTFSLTLPTTAFLEYLVNMRRSILENRSMLDASITEVSSKTRGFLDVLANESDPSKKRVSQKKH